MSLLDTIKSLFCNIISNKPASEQQSTSPDLVEQAVVSETGVKPEPELAPESKTENQPKTAPSAAIKVTPSPVNKPVAEKTSGLKIPEDSTLRRHFISILKTEIESKMPPRPTDSTLKRHYDAKVQAELNQLLDS